MKASSIYYTPTQPNEGRNTEQLLGESIIYLPAAQISPIEATKTPKSEQNHIIRLAASIKKYGILEPLCVKLMGNSSGFPLYELIDGERRFRAAALAGYERLPCTVLPSNAPKCLQQAFISRLKEENLHFFALAEAFYTLFHDYKMTQEEIARKMHLSQSAVANKLRLLRLPSDERLLIRQAGLSERHARALLRLESASSRKEALSLLLSGSQTVAEAEALIESFLPKKQAKTVVLAENPPVLGAKTPFLPISTHAAPTTGPSSDTALPHDTPLSEGQGITPRKFILRDLQPLYHSIERTLGIFKKTGAEVAYTKQEDENRALITILIPKKG